MSAPIRLASVLLILLASAGSLPSQVATGNIRGAVLDSSEAVIPGATVTLTNVDRGSSRVVPTNDRGDFDAPSMPLGEYQVTVEMRGFQKKVLSGVQLQVDQTAVLRITLQPGAVTETVVVRSAAPLLDAQTASLGQVIENRRIIELPLNGRNPFLLGLLAGGTTPFRGLATNLPFIAGGGRHSANDILLDGVDDNIRNFAGNVGRNGVSYIPSVDAVQEFKVKTNNFAAEYGHSAGYTMNVTIKSGANEFHGSAFEFLRNDKLDANNFVSNFAGRPKAKFRQNQFGGTLGGPFVVPGYNGRNRTFFFGDLEATRIRQAAGSSLSDVAPASFRSGDFSRSTRRVYDPASRSLDPVTGVVRAELFPNQIIPSTRLDPTVLEVQKLIPLPNVGAQESASRNFLATSPRELNRTQGDFRIDHRLRDNNNLMFRGSVSQQAQPNQGAFVYSPQTSLFNTRNFVLSDIHIFRPNLVNEFRFGFNRSNSSQLALKLDESIAFAAKNGLQSGPLIGFPSIGWTFSGESFGQAQFTGFGAAGSNPTFENSFQWADHISIIQGNHTMKTGVEVRRFRFDRLPGYPTRATVFFGATFTSNASVTQETGLPYADFLLGFPARAEGENQIDWSRQRDLYGGGYIQDDWKITRRLTLNLGLRYDLYTQPVDALDRGGVFDPDSLSSLGRRGVYRIPGKDGFSRAIVRGHHKNLGPRFGFAYQATSKFVVRGGYGIFFSQREQNRHVTELANTPLNFRIVTTPPVTAQRTVTPLFRFTSPFAVESSLDPNFSRYDATRPIAVQFMASDIDNSRFPTLHQANLSLQYEFKPGLLAEASYAGARGLRWVQRMEVNSVRFEDALAGRNRQPDRPFPYVEQTIAIDRAVVNSWYHSFNLRVERRFSRGLTFLTNYTISKSTQSGDSGSSQFDQEGSTRPMDPFNPKGERGLAPTDIPQKLVLSALYELPVKGRLLGGWQVNGILTLRAGFPSDIRVASTPPTFTTLNRPNRVLGESVLVSNPGFNQYFNPRAFTVPPTVPDFRGAAVRTYGNAGRNILRGPSSRNLDLSVFKSFRTTDKTSLQFRAEAFNLSNTPTFELPGARTPALTVGDATFGRLSSSQTVGRQLQFGLKFLF